MANIETRKNQDGSTTFRVQIRKKGKEIYKSFRNEEDANIFVFYKEKLLDNIENFDTKIESRVSLEQAFELKVLSFENGNKRNIDDYIFSLKRLNEYFKTSKNCDIVYLNNLNHIDWIGCALRMMNTHVYRGGKTEAGKRIMSFSTLRKIFAHAASCISFLQSSGMVLHNHPQEVIKSHISQKIKFHDELILTP